MSLAIVRPPRTGPNMRSKQGCKTCRGRKVKCDEVHPACRMCTRLGLACEWREMVRSLHERRVGAGSLRRRQLAGWTPPPIEAKPPLVTRAVETRPAVETRACGKRQGGGPRQASPPIPAARNVSSRTVTGTVLPLPESHDDADDVVDVPHDDVVALSHPVGSNSLCMDFLSSSPDDFVVDQQLFDLFCLGDLSSTSFAMPPSSGPASPLMMPLPALSMPPPLSSAVARALCAAANPSPLPELFLGTSTLILNCLPSRLQLGRADHEALYHFHHHVGLSVGSKSPVWSTHAILIKLAVHNPAILHLVLAASFSEMAWRRGGGASSSVPSSSSSASASLALSDRKASPNELARTHYAAGERALGELASQPQNAELYHVTIVASFWLEYLMQHRRQSSGCGGSARGGRDAGDVRQDGQQRSYAELSQAMSRHVQQYRLDFLGSADAPFASASGHAACGFPSVSSAAAYAATLPLTAPPVKYRAFLARLISWLFWVDCQASFFGQGGSLSRQFRGNPRSLLGLYQTARTTLLDFWEDYTPEEIADDNQNWPALQLVHETWVAVHRIHSLGADALEHAVGADDDTIDLIARDVSAMRQTYSSVFRLAAYTSPSRSRLLATADWATCNYGALLLYLGRAAAGSGAAVFTGSLVDPSTIAADIVHTAERAIRAVGKVEQDRFQWSLFWAGLETHNPVYRFFVQSNLINAELKEALQRVYDEEDSEGEELGKQTVSMGRLREICREAGCGGGGR